jgi:hypothetical protein
VAQFPQAIDQQSLGTLDSDASDRPACGQPPAQVGLPGNVMTETALPGHLAVGLHYAQLMVEVTPVHTGK